MRSHSTLLVIALTACGLGAIPADAQLLRNEQLRVTIASATMIEGHALSGDTTALVVWKAHVADTIRVARVQITTLERAAGSKKIGHGATIVGAIGGAVIGAFWGNAVRQNDLGQGGLLFPNFPYRRGGALIGAAVGALGGALVARVERTTWEAVSPYATVIP